jgi:hypothetical protein
MTLFKYKISIRTITIFFFIFFLDGTPTISQTKYIADYKQYNWIDISKTGKKITNWVNGPADLTEARDDGYTDKPLALGFTFKYFDNNYDSIYAGCNGLVSFTQKYLNNAAQYGTNAKDSIGFFDDYFPWPENPFFINSIAVAFADFDLIPNDGYGHGDVFYQTVNDQFILTWEKVGNIEQAGDTLNTFQMILDKATNSIILQYKYFGSAATRKQVLIGMQKDSGTGIGWCYKGIPFNRIPQNQSAVCFTPEGSISVIEKKLHDYKLEQNYPNPFNPSTVVSYQLSVVSCVVLNIYDVLGRKAATLVNGEKQPGRYSVNFDASNLPGGVYYYRLSLNGKTETKKMLYLK